MLSASMNAIRRPIIPFVAQHAKKEFTVHHTSNLLLKSQYIHELQQIQTQSNKVVDMLSVIQNDLLRKDKNGSLLFVNKEKMIINKPPASIAIDGCKIGYQMMNRNARKPNKANHGSRPCSRISRRAKRSQSGNSRRK